MAFRAWARAGVILVTPSQAAPWRVWSPYETSRDDQVGKSPCPLAASFMNDWKVLTLLASEELYEEEKDTGRLLSTMAAVKSCTHTPEAPVDRVWLLRPAWVPGPKAPLATPSAMPSSYWTARSIDLATSREW